MARRDAFSDLLEADTKSAETQAAPLENQWEPSAQGLQPLDLIPSAQPRARRKRGWEKAHRAETVTYRGVPSEYHALLGKIAEGLGVPRDEVARAFLEYSMELFQTGRLKICARPKAQRMTLFPQDGKSPLTPLPSSKEAGSWLSEVFPTTSKKSAAKKKGKEETPRWELRVTFRLPVPLKESIKRVAEEHTLPLGEVVWYFIEQALGAYRVGELRLQPVPRIAGKTLYEE